jgi:DNA-binding NarL/FixJ family response regulator
MVPPRSDLAGLVARSRAVRELLLSYRLLVCTAYLPYATLLRVNFQQQREAALAAGNPDGVQRLLGVCTSLREAAPLVPPDGEDVLVICGEMLEDGPTLPLLHELGRRPRRPRLLINLEVPHRVSLQASLAAGVDAVITEANMGRGVLLGALQALQAGDRYLDPSCQPLLERGGRASDELSQRELEILQLVAEGLTNRAIAEQLGIAEVTARDHVQKILQKLGAADRTAAAVQGLRRGYIH